MANRKTGLHKEIASIFDGVPLPKDKSAQQSSYDSGPGRPENAPTEIPHQNYSAVVNTSDPNPKSDTSPPKSIVSEQLKDDITIESYQQNWWRQIFEQVKAKFFQEKPGVNVNKQKAMVVLIPVLFIVLIFMFSRSLSKPVRGAKNPESTASTAAAKDKINWQIPDPYPATLRDPMQVGSVTSVQDQTDKPIVKGIIYRERSSSVIIGDQILKEGDEVSGAIIVKINKNSVEFEKKGERWVQKVQ